jgi:transcriptional regulator GlxA family with amidase domain
MNRRDFGGLAAGTFAAGIAGTAAAADDKSSVQVSEDRFPPMHGGPRPEIAMLVYPGLTMIDMLGPQTVLAAACNVHFVWKNTDLLESDTGVVLRPSMSLADCPKNLDAIFVGGGPGQIAVMKDAEVLRFLADRGARAKWVTSVCSGSLVLGAAGLLRGYKATCHWTAHEALRIFAATPVVARVVTDRNRVTGGGATAGIDFGLVLLAKLLGDEIAKMTQLSMEYDPQPPFDAGTPKKAGEKITKMALDWMRPLSEKMVSTCAAAAEVMDKYAPKP